MTSKGDDVERSRFVIARVDETGYVVSETCESCGEAHNIVCVTETPMLAALVVMAFEKSGLRFSDLAEMRLSVVSQETRTRKHTETCH